MGLVGVEENGNANALSLGSKNKYMRMDSSEAAADDDFDDAAANHHLQLKRSRSTRKYVFACAVFASLNSVLLGYGN